MLRKITLPIGVAYLVNLFYLSWNYSNETGIDHQPISEAIMIIFPIYMAVIAIVRSLKNSDSDVVSESAES
jgi:hypothetical protein